MDLAQTLDLGADNYISDAAYVFVQYLDNTSLCKLGMTCTDNYRVFDALFVPNHSDKIGSMRNWASYNRMHERIPELNKITIQPPDVERLTEMDSLDTAEILTQLGGSWRHPIFYNTVYSGRLPDNYDNISKKMLMYIIGMSRYSIVSSHRKGAVPRTQFINITRYLLDMPGGDIDMQVSYIAHAIDILHDEPELLMRLIDRSRADEEVLALTVSKPVRDKIVHKYIVHRVAKRVSLENTVLVIAEYPQHIDELFGKIKSRARLCQKFHDFLSNRDAIFSALITANRRDIVDAIESAMQ